MSLGAAIASFLASEPYGSQVYPVMVPKEATYPTVAYQILPGRGPLHTHDAYDATRPIFWRVRVQFTVRSKSYDEVDRVTEMLVRKLNGFRGDMGGVSVGSALVLGTQDGPVEPETLLLMRVVDVEIQYTSEATS